MKGSCMCGAVKISAEPARDTLSACHCDMCRQWCSGPFIAFESKPGARIQGPAKAVQTSEWAERGHCPECGSSLWYRMTSPEGSYNFAAGLFDTGDMPIGIEVWIDEKPAGYSLTGEHKKMTGAEIIAFFAPNDEGDAK